jgi:dTDP-glucose 4,6-dehydratase
MRILVTGHIGFIGSHFVKHVVANSDATVIGFSRWSTPSNMQRLLGIADCSRVSSVWGNLEDVSGICEGIDVVVNFAAKTFVDHSLKDRHPFIASNIIGADRLMEDATQYGVKRFIQVSTDEVYGQILEGAYKEDALLQPRNPYSWSKACADLDAIQRHRTYGFPVIITRTENNFGPWQHRQKALPTFVRAVMEDKLLPVYGDGLHVRCWLHVEEHCRAIWYLIQHGILGEVYHVAGEQELTNIDLAKLVLRTLHKPEDRLQFVPDHNIRPGHDRRYALNCDKLRATGFDITQNLEASLQETIQWYATHKEWTQ